MDARTPDTPTAAVADAASVSGRGRGGERGFSLMEIIVVMILIGIVLAAAVPSITSMKRDRMNPQYAVVAGEVWRAVSAYRLDYNGRFPPATMLANGGATLVNPAGTKYLRTWPADPSTGAALMVCPPAASAACAAAAPPASGPPNTVLYRSNGATAWLAAYGWDGAPVYVRSVSATNTPLVPVG